MKRWLFLALLVVACSSKHYDDDDDGGSGGESAGSGGSSSGGKGGVSGATAKGGTGTGGSSGNAVGGDTNVGGTTSAGGDGALDAGDGGMPSGGEPGGAEGGAGGTTGGTGGSMGGAGGSTAGTGGSAGQSGVTCDTDFSVARDGFVRMLAHDACWHGYAMSGGDTASSVYPKTWDNCGVYCQLSIIGTVSGTSSTGYAYLGFSVNQPAGGASAGTVTPTGQGIRIAHTYTSALPAYLGLKVSSSTTYCVELPESGTTTIPYTSFRTSCWDSSGKAYSNQAFQAIQVEIFGVESPANFNLHITSVEEI
ncbi:MAG TPA: hypothetical protein VFV94_09570 [Polyangiaceae bacterium]|nr:hypothetical protein [Polyangiaceae bacterium]